MKVAKYIAEFLFQKGVRTVFMLSGTGSIHLDDAFAYHKGLKYICARHEAAAVMMASANAKLRQDLGVVIATTGPGGTNAIGGLVEAWVDSAPVLVLSGQVSTNLIVENVRSFGVQGFNIIESVRPMTKYAKTLKDPGKIRYYLEKATYLAKSGRPGPVWLDIPLDIQAADIDIEKLDSYVPELIPDSKQEMDKHIDVIIGLLKKSTKPLFVVGQGVRNAGAIPEFKTSIELVNAPFIASRLGQDILSYSHRNYFGLGGMRGRRYSKMIMKQADLVISLGSSLSYPFAGEKCDAFSRDAKIVMVNIDEAELNKPTLRIDFPIKNDVKKMLIQLIMRVRDESLPDYGLWLRTCQGYKTKYPTVIPEYKRNPINSYYFLERLENYSNGKHIFVNDAGSAYYIGGQTLQFNKGQREVTSGAFASMGLAIPLAIGCATVDNDLQVLAVTGDGSMEVNIQELRTISHNNLNIKVFIINNGGYASIRHAQDNIVGGRYTDDSAILNFAKVADAFELPFHLIEKYEELDKQIPQILQEKGPTLIEVVCDREQEILSPLEEETN